MGETLSSEKQQPIQQKLQPVQQLEDPAFGPIEIFRLKEPPYEYIMDYRKTFMEGDKRIQYYCDFVKTLQGMEHKNLAKIHQFEMKEETHMCIKDRKAHVYCNYYNFTLAQAIEKKKKTNCVFAENDLLYILGCLVSLGQYLKKFKIYLGQYRASQIFISPEGYIKVYLLELEQEDKHNCYFKALSEKSTIEQYILAPEQLTLIQNLEYEIRFDIEKADVFAIGMIILQLLTLDQTKFFYNEDYSALKIGKINFTLDSLKEAHSEGFLSLLKACLHENPSKRYSFDEANKEIEQLKKKMQNLSYCIRLQDEQDSKNRKTLQPGISNKNVRAPSLPIGLGKQLTPAPISTISTHKATPITSLASTPSSQFKPSANKVHQYNSNVSSQYASKRESHNTGLHSPPNGYLSTNSSHINSRHQD